jgi:hypothetical protein
MFRYLAEPRNILAEPLGSAEPWLKNTVLDLRKSSLQLICLNPFQLILQDLFPRGVLRAVPRIGCFTSFAQFNRARLKHND